MRFDVTNSSTNREKTLLAALAVGAALQVASLLAPSTASANEKLTTQARADLRPYGSSSAFCYVEENGAVTGVNPDQPVKIASVMKTLTTLWAVEKYGPHFEYGTKIYYQASNGEMHISGARDPFFDRDRIYLLISDLNRLGIKKINRLTIDGNFLYNPDLFEFEYKPAMWNAYMYTEAHADQPLGRVNLKEKMASAFNTDQWWKDKRARYGQTKAKNPTSNMVAVPEMTTAVVDLVPGNPLAGKPGVVVLETKSRPLMHYLKKMNIHSLNASADELFYSMGGASAFTKFLTDKYRMGGDAVDIHTGSGLPLHNPRNDSSMSCSAVVRLIRRLDVVLESQGLDMADVMMVSGLDAGATYKDGSQALVVKTGTLNGVKNLAGVANTTTGEVYFGIFLQNGGNVQGVRNVVARMKSNYRMTPVRRQGFQWDSLDPKMTLRPVGPKVTVGAR